MPIEELLAQYAKAPNPEEEIADNSRSASTSSSEEEILENQDLTLDKEVITRDLLNNATPVEDRDISVNELIQNVSRSQTLSHTERLLRCKFFLHFLTNLKEKVVFTQIFNYW